MGRRHIKDYYMIRLKWKLNLISAIINKMWRHNGSNENIAEIKEW